MATSGLGCVFHQPAAGSETEVEAEAEAEAETKNGAEGEGEAGLDSVSVAGWS